MISAPNATAVSGWLLTVFLIGLATLLGYYGVIAEERTLRLLSTGAYLWLLAAILGLSLRFPSACQLFGLLNKLLKQITSEKNSGLVTATVALLCAMGLISILGGAGIISIGGL